MPFSRTSGNPIITRHDIRSSRTELTDVTSVFNPGAVRTERGIQLILRVQNRGRETLLVPAISKDGIHFACSSEPLILHGLERLHYPVYHVYDPRITKMDDKYYIVVAIDTDDRCVLAIFQTSDFVSAELVGLRDQLDTRNGVLFPEQIDGEFLLLERPNRATDAGSPASGDQIVLSRSSDLLNWRIDASIMQGRWHYWDERIGAGPPPIKTRAGWLLIYHGIATHFQSVNIYQAGVALLDLKDPSKLIARCRYNFLEPRELWELTGQVPNVVFPSGVVVEQIDDDGFALPDSPCKLYYGAADTCIGLLEGTVSDLLQALHEGN